MAKGDRRAERFLKETTEETAASLTIQDGDTTTTTRNESGITVDCTKKSPGRKKQQQPFTEETARQHFFQKTTGEAFQEGTAEHR